MDEPQPERDDIFITSGGPLGATTYVRCGKALIYRGVEPDEALEAIRTFTDQQNYFPNVWTVSDHGNHTLTDY